MMVVVVMMFPGARLRVRHGSKKAERGCDQCYDEQFLHGRLGVWFLVVAEFC